MIADAKGKMAKGDKKGKNKHSGIHEIMDFVCKNHDIFD